MNWRRAGKGRCGSRLARDRRPQCGGRRVRMFEELDPALLQRNFEVNAMALLHLARLSA